ncbi:MAG: LysE family transporter [Anaerolineae bacterium]|nr:LysE family transporter [Anaerolineae bacterium]
MLPLIAPAIYLGATATIMPGPLQTYVISSALDHGWRKSLILGFTPLLADIPIMIIVLFIAQQFPPELLRALNIVGGAFILFLAYSGYKNYRQGATIGGSVDHAEADQTSAAQLLWRGILLNALSPVPLIFWSTLHAPNILRTNSDSPLTSVLYIVAFYGTFFLGITIIILIFDRVRQLSPRITRTLILITIVVLALFGLSLIYQGLTTQSFTAA